MSLPEFSIICRTEGGPATHVTWVGPNGKVQEDSDHETSQIIVDTSNNSVYANRLRMRGRKSGTYTCLIENDSYHTTGVISFATEQIKIMGL